MNRYGSKTKMKSYYPDFKTHHQSSREHYLICVFNNALSTKCDTGVSITNIFPGGSSGKASAYNVGDPGLIPGAGRSSGEGNDNPLQYSCLENLMDRGAW